MAHTVAVVQTTADGSGAGVALDRIGTTDYQKVKLVAGQTSETLPIAGTTAAPAGAAVGLVVRQVDGVSVTAGVSGTVSVATGTVSVSGPVQVSGTVSLSGTQVVTLATGGTLATLLGTVEVNIVAGAAGGTTVVSGTVSLVGIAPVTTQASVSVTALPVWWNPTAVVAITPTVLTVNTAPTVAGASITIQQGASVSAVVSGTVTPIGTLAVTGTIQNIASISTVLGTAMVSIAQTSVSVAAVPTVNTVVTILGTQVVTVVPGLSVSAVVSGTVSILNVVPVTTQASVSVTGIPVYWNPTATIQVSGQVVATTTQAVATGALMWLAPTQTIMAKEVGYNPFMLFVSSTVGGSVGTTLLFTVWTGGSLVGAGLTQWAVPAGQVLRMQNIQAVINSSAVTGGTFQVMVNAATASGSFTSANQGTIGRPVMLQMLVSAGVTAGSVIGFNADVLAATTIGVRHTAPTAMVIGNVIIQGYLLS